MTYSVYQIDPKSNSEIEVFHFLSREEAEYSASLLEGANGKFKYIVKENK